MMANASEDVTSLCIASSTSVTGNDVTTEWPTSDNPSPTTHESSQIPLWSQYFDIVQLTCTSIGFFANIVTFITLVKNSKGFGVLALLLLRHQCLVDAVVCAMASIVLIQPQHWLTGNYYVDVLVCHAWHGQALYWGAVTVSTYNLVLIAMERYKAICQPFQHAQLCCISRKKCRYIGLTLYGLSLFITHGTYLQTRLDSNECLNELAFDGPIVARYFFGFVIFTYLTTYLIPVLIMVILYFLVIRALRKRGRDLDLGHSKTVDRASAQLTKSAIAVTIIFLLSMGYDLHYYLLGHTGVAVYQLNTPIQKVGVFISNLNSCANPLVYALIMPIYRQSLRMTFCSCCVRQQSYAEGTSGENSISSMSVGMTASTRSLGMSTVSSPSPIGPTVVEIPV